MLDSFHYNYYLTINNFGFYKKRAGVCFTANMITGICGKRFNKPHRFKTCTSGNSIVRLVLLAPLLPCLVAMSGLLGAIIICLFEGQPWLEYAKWIGWLILINFALVNLTPYLSTFVKEKCVYFDREKQKSIVYFGYTPLHRAR